MSLIPIRCYNCGKTLANKYEAYLLATADLPQIEFMEAGDLSSFSKRAVVMNDLGILKECCRTVMLTHVYDNRIPVNGPPK